MQAAARDRRAERRRGEGASRIIQYVLRSLSMSGRGSMGAEGLHFFEKQWPLSVDPPKPHAGVPLTRPHHGPSTTTHTQAPPAIRPPTAFLSRSLVVMAPTPLLQASSVHRKILPADLIV